MEVNVPGNIQNNMVLSYFLVLEVDLACVVIRSGIVGGSGADIALSLLNKGINVLQEQPVSYVEAANCMKTANSYKKSLFLYDK